MEQKQGTASSTWVILHKKKPHGEALFYERSVKIIGTVKEFIDGKFTREFPNTVTTAFKNASAQGAAVGTFVEVDTGRMNYAAGNSGACATTKIAGGTGVEDYVTFEFEWTNGTGVSKTITSIDLGADLEGGGEVIYFQQTGLSVVVANGAKIKYRWTITIAYTSGGVTNEYRYALAKMVYSGAMDVPAYGIFIDSGTTEHAVAASLETGGTGAEAYHQWEATYTATGAITIDVVNLSSTDDAEDSYTEDDINDVDMEDTDELEAHVRITHN